MPDTTLMQTTEFDTSGSIVRITTHKLHEHESALLIQECKAYFEGSGRNQICIDFEQVEFISSAALGAMVTLNTELAKLGGRLVVVNLNENAMQVIKLTKLDKLIPVEKSVEKAQKRLLKG
jgi:anti-sigma B factor antagonist